MTPASFTFSSFLCPWNPGPLYTPHLPLSDHLVSARLCIEAMMLALDLALTTSALTTHLPSMTISPILLLAFSACQAGTGLALLVATSQAHNTDHLKNLNLLQC